MKWFFALNEKSDLFPQYAEMLKVAVHSASQRTQLEPCLLYDGEENELTAWLRRRGVTIIKHRSFLYEDLQAVARKVDNDWYLACGAGAFLRTEIPTLAEELGIDDEYVLYTDCDVMFLDDVARPLSELSPRIFAVAPESDPTDYSDMNTGAMLMNLPELRKYDRAFRRFIKANCESLAMETWDQAAYRRFFLSRWRRKPLWDELPVEYNWKPYWGDNPAAKIVHFHGPKPHHRVFLEPGYPVPSYQRFVIPMMTDTFLDLCDRWEAFRAEAAER